MRRMLSAGLGAVLLAVGALTAVTPAAGAPSPEPTTRSDLPSVQGLPVRSLAGTGTGAGGPDAGGGAAGAAAAQAGTQVAGAALGVLPSTSSPGYVSVDPTRILDTRSGLGAARAAVGAGRSIDLQVTGRGGVPASGVTSVVLNVTATAPTANGYVAVHPTGAARPAVSNLNFSTGATVANAVLVKLGTGGRVTLFNVAGSVQVIADVQGYFQTGSDYTALTPARVLDTRSGNGAPRATVGAGRSIDVTMTGRGGVPATGVSAVALNVTLTAPTSSGYLTVYPTGAARPVASNLNYRAGTTVAVAAIAAVGTGGKVSFFNAAGSSEVIADVSGYFAEDGQYVPITPQRRIDSRVDWGTLPADSWIDMKITGLTGVADTAVSAVALSVTAISPTSAGYLAVGPYTPAETPPLTSSVNFARGVTTPNLVIVKVGVAGWVRLYNRTGAAHFLVDVAGYFTSDAVPTFTEGVAVPVGIDIDGTSQGNGGRGCPTAVTDDGRYALFFSTGDRMRPYFDWSDGDSAGIYVRDIALGITTTIVYLTGGQTGCPLSLSADGRWALWASEIRIYEADTNNAFDLFASDLSTGLTYPISWSLTTQRAPNGATSFGGMSPNARYVAFTSTATDIVTGTDPNGSGWDVFLLDTEDPLGGYTYTRLAAGGVTYQPVSDDGRVAFTATGAVPGLPGFTGGAVLWDGSGYQALSVRSNGTVVSGGFAAYLSADGLAASFTTNVGLSAVDTNAVNDVYLRTLQPAATTLVSDAFDGGPSTGEGSYAGPVSRDGTFVVFESSQTNIVPDDTGFGTADVYRWSATGGNRQVSVEVDTDTGEVRQVAGNSYAPNLSPSGEFVAYLTQAALLNGAGGDLGDVVTWMN